MNAILALEDGTWYAGVSAGAPGETTGEVVFNTSMTGYQEVLTDPSYAGQIVTMTTPQIGNYGVAAADVESARNFAEAALILAEAPGALELRRLEALQGIRQVAPTLPSGVAPSRLLVRHFYQPDRDGQLQFQFSCLAGLA